MFFTFEFTCLGQYFCFTIKLSIVSFNWYTFFSFFWKIQFSTLFVHVAHSHCLSKQTKDGEAQSCTRSMLFSSPAPILCLFWQVLTKTRSFYLLAWVENGNKHIFLKVHKLLFSASVYMIHLSSAKYTAAKESVYLFIYSAASAFASTSEHATDTNFNAFTYWSW